MYHNNNIDEFKNEYPPYLKWGGKYININKPTLLDNGFNSTTNKITINYDWCESNLPAGDYKFKISLCEFENHDAILIDAEDTPIPSSSDGYTSETYHKIYKGQHDYLDAEYNNVNFNFDISSVINDEIISGEYYQIKIEVIKIGGFDETSSIENRGFEKVYTTFSQPFIIK